MKNRGLIIILVIVSILWFLGSSYCYVCILKDDCSSPKEIVKKVDDSNKLKINGLHITDGKDLDIRNENNIYFDHGGSSLHMENTVKVSFDKLAEYLRSHPEKNLVATGKYTKSEGDSDLGLKRADSFIKMFSGRYEIDSERFKSSHKEVMSLPIDLELKRTYNALGFEFNIDKSKLLEGDSSYTKEELSFDIEDLKKHRIVYFESGSPNMKTDAKLHQYFTDLKNYIIENKGSKAYITGHTDSQGSNKKNIALSSARTKDVMSYLIKNHGYDTATFSTKGFGEEKPIAGNDTEVGRAKNRRVEIQLAN